MTEPLRYPLRPGSTWRYGPWHLHPSRDWTWHHEDYDGPGDTRFGTAADRDD